MSKPEQPDPIAEFKAQIGSHAFKPVLADPAWQLVNRTGKVAPVDASAAMAR
jgi:hypothetical protein